MRNIDRLTTEKHAIPSLQLMHNAARACFLEIEKIFSGNLTGRQFLILCGPGNNGGDGAALAQQLLDAGVTTRLILFGRVADSKGDARKNFEMVRQLAGSETASPLLSFTECTSLSEWETISSDMSAVDLVVDALFGTGLTRPLTGLFATVVEHLLKIRSLNVEAGRRPRILSVDLPSGLNADMPKPIGPTVQADFTVTFTAPKQANVFPPAAHFNGLLKIADIGSPQQLIESFDTTLFVIENSDARNWLVKTRYIPESFKNTHGHVLVIAGSKSYTGAAVLCGNAAMSSGAGLVTVASPASAQSSVAANLMPEVITASLAETDRGAVSDDAIDHVSRLAKKASVIAIGPGLSSDDERTRRFVHSVVKNRRTPVVIDADGLNCLAPWPDDVSGTSEAPLILTPHAGEMLRLLGTDDRSALDDRVSAAQEFATRHNLILVLKGSRVLIASAGRVSVNTTGNAGVGTAGSGDTLTGLIAGFIAQAIGTLGNSANVLEATMAAVYVGGLAGDLAAHKLGMRTMVASDIRQHFGAAICGLDPEGERPQSVSS